MRSSRLFTCLLFAAILPAAALPQVNHTTTVTLARVYAQGALAANGHVCAIAVDQYGSPIAFSETGWGLIQANSPFCADVLNGTILNGLPVPDAYGGNALAPIFYNFSLQLTDPSGVATTAPIVLYNKVAGVTSQTFALDNYVPPVTAALPYQKTLGYGSAVPTTCTPPSLWSIPGNPSVLVCNGGVYIPGTTASYSVGTTTGTIAAGDDARIVAAIKDAGQYDNSKSYSLDDFVQVGTGVGALTYFSKVPGFHTNTSNLPTPASAFWQVMSQTGPVGPAGAAGAAGPAGVAGAPGAAGPAGATGPTGLAGPAGPTGAAGSPGAAATVGVGTITGLPAGSSPAVTNSGSPSAAVLNFALPSGPAGAQGPVGQSGPAGPTGVSGATGPAGSQGPAGASGPAGSTGAAGAPGAAATVGVGTVTGLPAGSTPAVNNSGSSSAAIFNFALPAGPTGAAGPAGAAGSQGPQGTAGPTGAAGLSGPIGPAGATGSAGAQGAAGPAATVAVGTVTGLPAGSTPAVNNSGSSSAAIFNFALPAGPTGAAGPAGAAGSQGPQGTAGSAGTTGPAGSIGPAGANGPAGAPAAIVGTDSGLASAYVVSTAATPAAGQQVAFIALNSNIGPTTVTMNGGTAVQVTKGGKPLAPGDIFKGQASLFYTPDGTNYQLLNPAQDSSQFAINQPMNGPVHEGTEQGPNAGTTFFVDCGPLGNDSNNGYAPSSPWSTIAYATSHSTFYAPGNRILLKRGCEWHEQMVLPNTTSTNASTTLTSNPPLFSGSATEKMYIGAYGEGAAPLLDAADQIQTTGGWTLVAGTTYQTTLLGTAANNVTYSGGILTVSMPYSQMWNIWQEVTLSGCANADFNGTGYVRNNIQFKPYYQFAIKGITPVESSSTGCVVTFAPLKLYVDSPISETTALVPQGNYRGTWTAATASGATPYAFQDVIADSGGNLWYANEMDPGTASSFDHTYYSQGRVAADLNTNSGIANVQSKLGSWYVTGRTLYVNLPDGSNPTSHYIEGTVRLTCYLAESVNYVQVADLACERGAGGFASMVWSDPNNGGVGDYKTNENNVFKNLKVWNWGQLVSAYGGGNFYGNQSGYNYIMGPINEGIVFTMYSNTNTGNPFPRNNKVLNNYVGTSDNVFGESSFNAGILIDGSDHVEVANNYARTVNDQAIVVNIWGNLTPYIHHNFVTNSNGNYFVGSSPNAIFEYNTAINSFGEGLQSGGCDNTHGPLLCDTNVVIDHNIMGNIKGSLEDNLGINGHDCAGSSGVPVTGVEAYNTYFNTPGEAHSFEGGSGCNLYVVNNIFDQSQNNSGGIFYDLQPSAPTFASNLYYVNQSSAGHAANTRTTGGTTTYYTIQNWLTFTGEAGAIIASPQMRSPTTGNFTPMSTSPAKGAAIPVTGVSSPTSDIGAAPAEVDKLAARSYVRAWGTAPSGTCAAGEIGEVNTNGDIITSADGQCQSMYAYIAAHAGTGSGSSSGVSMVTGTANQVVISGPVASPVAQLSNNLQLPGNITITPTQGSTGTNNYSSNLHSLCNSYQNAGSIDTQDCYTWQATPGTGLNPATTLTLATNLAGTASSGAHLLNLALPVSITGALTMNAASSITTPSTATASVNYSSPIWSSCGSGWTTLATADCWTFQDQLGVTSAGAYTSTGTWSHTGSGSAQAMSFPKVKTSSSGSSFAGFQLAGTMVDSVANGNYMTLTPASASVSTSITRGQNDAFAAFVVNNTGPSSTGAIEAFQTSGVLEAQVNRLGLYEVAVGTAVTEAATIAPTAALFHLTGNSASLATITVPQGMSSTVGGCFTMVTDAAVTLVSTGNIASASVTNSSPTVAGKAYNACYDGSKWSIN